MKTKVCTFRLYKFVCKLCEKLKHNVEKPMFSMKSFETFSQFQLANRKNDKASAENLLAIAIMKVILKQFNRIIPMFSCSVFFNRKVQDFSFSNHFPPIKCNTTHMTVF